MKVKIYGLVLVGAAFLVVCGEKDLNKDFKPVANDAPMPTAAAPGTPNQATPPTSPP